MLAVQIVQPQMCRVVNLAKPNPAMGQVRVRLQGCGICASSLSLWEGREWFRYPAEPGTPGHEGWGKVDKIGKGVSGLKCGDRVTFLSNHAFAEYDLAFADQVVALPDYLSEKPFPGEALACALNIFDRSDVRANQTIAIVGLGFLGLLLTRLCSNIGARVIAISRRAYSRQMAKSFGASVAVSLDREPERTVAKLTGGNNCARVIEAVGLQSTLDIASSIVADGGKLIIAGYHQDGCRIINLQQWNWRGIDVINAHERDPNVYIRGMKHAIKESLDGALSVPVLTHYFSIYQMEEAFKLLRARPDGFIKGFVRLQ
jgi:threonine dehydrogenase-like Zn-dependent dehydrogenase